MKLEKYSFGIGDRFSHEGEAQLGAIIKAKNELGIDISPVWNKSNREHTIVQVASGRFGVHPKYLDTAAAVEIKIGQGAKPGIGGHLPGEKVTEHVAKTRMIPEGTDALSPYPQHDIYSIEDLRQLICGLKEATNYTKPISVKIAAVHNAPAIASGRWRYWVKLRRSAVAGGWPDITWSK